MFIQPVLLDVLIIVVNKTTHKNKFIFYCASGWRSSLSAKTAFEMGLKNVLNLENGFDDWINQDGPVDKFAPKKKQFDYSLNKIKVF